MEHNISSQSNNNYASGLTPVQTPGSPETTNDGGQTGKKKKERKKQFKHDFIKY